LLLNKKRTILKKVMLITLLLVVVSAQTQDLSTDRVSEAWVQHYASGRASGYDAAVDVGADTEGNVIVTGYSSNSAFGMDYLTIKYDAIGNQVWKVRYNGESNGEDRAIALTIDNAGDIYVTGRSWDDESAFDYVTVKYNSSGVLQWADRRDVGSSTYEQPADIAVDNSGNIVVTGPTTIKYTAADELLWAVKNKDLGQYYVSCVALSIDKTNNVYVTGSFRYSRTKYDVVTTKYNPDGEVQWTVVYDGPAEDNDWAEDIAVDDAGNVFVAGCSKGIETDYDYAVIKYDSSGEQQWGRRYNGLANESDSPSSIAVDGLGNVYVTGRNSRGSYNTYCTTIKYSSSGDQLWINEFGYEEDSLENGVDLVLDSLNNVYVTGMTTIGGTIDYLALKYDSLGRLEWNKSYGMPQEDKVFSMASALTISHSGIYITGRLQKSYSDNDYATVKYSLSGEEEWAAHYDESENSYDEAYLIAADKSGNFAVAGTSSDFMTHEDFIILKYNEAGVLDWENRYSGFENSIDAPSDMLIDESGNIIVTGTGPSTTSGFYAYITIKYDDKGNEQWIAEYKGGDGDNQPKAMALDVSGNIFVTGLSDGDDVSGRDFATVKYNPQGTEEWCARYNGAANRHDYGTAITVDGYGDVCVTGVSQETYSSQDITTIKYSTSGEKQWIARYADPEERDCKPIKIAIDKAGSIYVAGTVSESYNSSDFILIKYTNKGQLLWVKTFDGLYQSHDEIVGMLVDANGNVYVAGNSEGNDDETTASYHHAVIIKYAPTGAQEWIRSFEVDGSFSGIEAIASDHVGNIYIAGQTQGNLSPRNYDSFTIKYDVNGEEYWRMRYEGPSRSDDFAKALTVDASGNIYVAGNSGASGWSIFTIIKYELELREPIKPQFFSLYQNYPNPFNSSTTIRYALPEPCFVSLEIYNVLGEKVVALIDEPRPPGDYSVLWRPEKRASGVYICRMQAGNFIESKRILLLR